MRPRVRARGPHEVAAGRRPGADASSTPVDDVAPPRELVAFDRIGCAADDPGRAEIGRVALEVDAGVDPDDVAGLQLDRLRRSRDTSHLDRRPTRRHHLEHRIDGVRGRAALGDGVEERARDGRRLDAGDARAAAPTAIACSLMRCAISMQRSSSSVLTSFAGPSTTLASQTAPLAERRPQRERARRRGRSAPSPSDATSACAPSSVSTAIHSSTTGRARHPRGTVCSRRGAVVVGAQHRDRAPRRGARTDRPQADVRRSGTRRCSAPQHTSVSTPAAVHRRARPWRCARRSCDRSRSRRRNGASGQARRTPTSQRAAAGRDRRVRRWCRWPREREHPTHAARARPCATARRGTSSGSESLAQTAGRNVARRRRRVDDHAVDARLERVERAPRTTRGRSGRGFRQHRDLHAASRGKSSGVERRAGAGRRTRRASALWATLIPSGRSAVSVPMQPSRSSSRSSVTNVAAGPARARAAVRRAPAAGAYRCARCARSRRSRVAGKRLERVRHPADPRRTRTRRSRRRGRAVPAVSPEVRRSSSSGRETVARRRERAARATGSAARVRTGRSSSTRPATIASTVRLSCAVARSWVS